MAWPLTRGNKKNKNDRRRGRDRRSRRLRVESLERREVLSGTVTATVTGGVLTLQGDGLDNQVTIETNGFNSYLVSGQNGTSIVDVTGSVKSAHTVTGVTGNVNVALDPAPPGPPAPAALTGANDSFTILPQASGVPTSIPANLNIFNNGFGDMNVIGNANIGGTVNIATQFNALAAGTVNTISASLITGAVNVTNPQGSTLNITNSATTNTTINGSLTVINGPGAKTNIGDATGRLNVNGNVIIVNDSTNENTITNTAIGGATGGLWVVKKDNVSAGSQTLTIQNNTNVFGPTVITNFSVQTGPIAVPSNPPGAPLVPLNPIPVAATTGGSTKLTVSNSQLQGNPTNPPIIVGAAVSSLNQVGVSSVNLGTAGAVLPNTVNVIPGLPVYVPLVGVIPALLVNNGAGQDTTLVQGAMTTIGAGVAQPGGLNSLNDSVQIRNRNGGGMVTFGPDASDPTGRVNVVGGMAIQNGTNADGVIDTTILTQTNVSGRVYVYNAGGAGATNTMITSSNIGTTLTGGQLGNPLAVFNDAGPDLFSMTSSSVPWGAYINHDSNTTPIVPGGPVVPGGGLDTSSASTTITGGQIGTRATGPSNAAGLSASLAAAFPAPQVPAPNPPNIAGVPVAGVPLPFPHPFITGDGLGIGGSAGSDVVNIMEATTPATPLAIGGFVDIVTSILGPTDLPDTVNITGNTTTPTSIVALNIFTGNANDTILLQDVVIAGTPLVPPPIPTSLGIFTNLGVDTLTIGDNVSITPLAAPFVFVLSGGTATDGDTLVDPNGVLTPFLPTGVVVFP